METTIKRTVEEIKEQIESLDDREIVNLHNQYCDSCNYPDDQIFENDEEFFNTYFDGKPMEAARSVFYGDYRYMDDFVKFNGYANLESINEYNLKEFIDIDAIAEDICENPENYYLDFEFEETEE